jgi:hypothetical protein
MKPTTVFLAAAGLMLGVQALAWQGGAGRIQLPLYDKPVSFFEEGKQAITVGSLPKGIKSLSADACAGCHREEHAEWKDSAHARSVTEPVFAAAFEAEPRFLCRSCHSPLMEQHPRIAPLQSAGAPRGAPQVRESQPVAGGAQPSSGPQPAVQEAGNPNPHYLEGLRSEGVTCVTCHVRDGTVLSAKPTASAGVPHALSYSPMMAKADFCGGCHQFDIQNPQAHPFEKVMAQLRGLNRIVPGRAGAAALLTSLFVSDSTETTEEQMPISPEPSFISRYHQEARVQHTVDEFRLSPAAAKGENCQSCHMPAGPAGRRHNWPGRNDLAMLRQAVTVSASLDRAAYQTGETLRAVIKLKNNAAHRFPTGDSIHAGILDVWLQDGNQTLGRQVFAMSEQSGSSQISNNDLLVQRELVETRLQQVEQKLGQAIRLTALEDPWSRRDTRLLPGEEAILTYTQPVSASMAGAKNPTLRVRLLHSAIHPGFHGSSLDPRLSPLQLIHEQALPVAFGAAPPDGQQKALVASKPPAAAVDALSLSARLDRGAYGAGDKLQAVIRVKNSAAMPFPALDSKDSALLEVTFRDGETTLGGETLALSSQDLRRQDNPRDRRIRVAPQQQAPPDPSGARLEGPGRRSDSRLLAGEEAILVFRQVLSKAVTQAKKPVLQVRLLHCPGDAEGSKTPRLLREVTLPVLLSAAAGAEKKP